MYYCSLFSLRSRSLFVFVPTYHHQYQHHHHHHLPRTGAEPYFLSNEHSIHGCGLGICNDCHNCLPSPPSLHGGTSLHTDTNHLHSTRYPHSLSRKPLALDTNHRVTRRRFTRIAPPANISYNLLLGLRQDITRTCNRQDTVSSHGTRRCRA